jgi:hypothetical protein
MYGHKARNSLIAILKEAPELKIGEPPKSVLKPQAYAKIVDRLLIELWMHGFAVSARKVGSKPPKDAPDQKAWRERKLAKADRRRQRDVEGQPHSDAPGERPDHPSAAAPEAVPQSS